MVTRTGPTPPRTRGDSLLERKWMEEIAKKAAAKCVAASTPAASVTGVVAEELYSYSFPRQILQRTGDAFQFRLWGTFGAVAGNKTVEAKYNGATATLLNVAMATGAADTFSVDLIVQRKAAGGVSSLGRVTAETATVPTMQGQTSVALTDTTETDTISFWFTGPAAGSITLESVRVDYFPFST